MAVKLHRISLRDLVIALFVLPVAAGCGGDGDGTTTPAPTDLSGELITASDLPGEWDTPGPQPISQPEGEVPTTLGPMCPDGETATLDDAAGIVLAAGNATIRLSSLGERQLEVEELLFHDDEAALFEALSVVFESCVGSPFEQGGDPVETVQWKPLDITLPADDVVALLERWGTGGELDGGETGHVIINAGTVTMMLSVVSDEITEPYDDELLVTAATAALDLLADDVWPPGVLDAAVAPELDAPNEITVQGPGEIVIRSGDGCRFFEDNRTSYAISFPDQLNAVDFEPNTVWFLEQAFATYPDIFLDVQSDLVILSVYETTDTDDPLDGPKEASLEITEQVAADLQQRIGNRAICN